MGRTETTGKTIARQRSLYQKSSSIESQNVEIHVATPPGKTRADQDVKGTLSDAVAQNPSILRRLFQDDDSEKTKPAPAVSSISGIPYRSPSKVGAVDSGASQTESQPLSNGIPVPPASTRPDDIFRRSRIESKAEGSRIPPPSTKSPVLRSKLTSRASSISRSQDSPPQESKTSPSRIPKPARATSLSMINFKLPNKSPSKDDGDENLARALNVRDHFLDSPIPSSAPTPTPIRSDSNVTVRARRRLTTTSSEESKLMAPDPIPVPVSATSAVEAQPPRYEDKPSSFVADAVSTTDALSSEPPHLSRNEDQHPHEVEPLPPTNALGSAIFEQERQQNADQRAEEAMLALEEKPAPVVVNSFQEAEAGHTIDDQVADSNDADIEETMLINREVTARDYAEKVPVTRERVGREEKGSDSSLPNDALVNLRGIQEKMARLQALTRVDIRGLPMKPRGGNVAESPVARPRSAGRMHPVFSEPLPQSHSQPNNIDKSSIANSRQAAERGDFSHQRRDSESVNRFFEVEEEMKRHVAESRAIEEKNHEAMHDFKPPLNRGLTPSQHSERDYETRQQDFPVQRRRVGKQASADIHRKQVEKQFQGLVREAQASSSRPSSAERQTVISNTSSIPVGLSSQDATSFAALVNNGNGTRNAMEPPLQSNMKPATAVNRREPAATQPENRGSYGEPSRLPASVRRSGAQPGTSRSNQSNSERTTKPSWVSSYTGYFCVLLGFIFGASGLLRAATTVRDTHDYHQALKMRIGMFEASISESYESVRKLEENYAVWSEYVRVLAEEDETHALSLLETIQHEVEKWQVDMKHDLTHFKKSLSVDVVEAALAPLLKNATEKGDL